MKGFLKKLLDIWCNWWFLIIIILVIVFGLLHERKSEDIDYGRQIDYSEVSDKAKIETLEDENSRLQEELSHTESLLEETQRENEYKDELITILQDQLESHGIEPEEL